MPVSFSYKYKKEPEKEEKLKHPPKQLLGFQKLARFALLICFLLTAWIVVYSKIVDYETETLLLHVLYQNVIDWRSGVSTNNLAIVSSERELVTQVDKELATKLQGYILLQIEEKGQAWYINPDDLERYFLGLPEDAIKVMKRLGEGRTNRFITSNQYNEVLGKVLIDVEDEGKIYYIYPKDKKAYLLVEENIYSVIREVGMGISNKDLRKIEVGDIQSIN